MSKERELLRLLIRVKVLLECSNVEPLQRHSDLIVGEIKELLAQPEQDQEPVAWIYEWVDEAGEPVKSVAYNFYDDANPIPLYTAPPKREPLTPLLISLGNNCHESFIKGVRFAEKMHGIGVEL